MARNRHDQFAKQLLVKLLHKAGEVETSREVAAETQRIDVWFSPGSRARTADNALGLLGKMAERPCLLEPFRDPPADHEIRDCMLKLFTLHSEQRREARRRKRSVRTVPLPRLWILAPSMSERRLKAAGASVSFSTSWPEGVHFLPPTFGTAIVTIDRLPETPDTLWLRLMGRGRVQRQAIRELLALPAGHSLRAEIITVMLRWRIQVEQSTAHAGKTEREFLMNTEQIYEQWERETLQKGLQQGRQQGQQALLEQLLVARFGPLDAELEALLETLATLSSSELARLLFSASKEDLLERFGQDRSHD